MPLLEEQNECLYIHHTVRSMERQCLILPLARGNFLKLIFIWILVTAQEAMTRKFTVTTTGSWDKGGKTSYSHVVISKEELQILKSHLRHILNIIIVCYFCFCSSILSMTSTFYLVKSNSTIHVISLFKWYSIHLLSFCLCLQELITHSSLPAHSSF